MIMKTLKKLNKKGVDQNDFCSSIKGPFMYSPIKYLLNTLEDG